MYLALFGYIMIIPNENLVSCDFSICTIGFCCVAPLDIPISHGVPDKQCILICKISICSALNAWYGGNARYFPFNDCHFLVLYEMMMLRIIFFCIAWHYLISLFRGEEEECSIGDRDMNLYI